MLRTQFTYTASRRPGAWGEGAGWKVQSVTDVPGAEPLPADVVRQAARSVGGFVPPPLPELASRADVDVLPRRLRLDMLDPPLACVSHVVAAGPDYSGRPNFFAHGLVLQLGDEDADDRGFLRPADLWDADFWLRPLGAQGVEACVPDAALRQLRRGSLDEARLERFTRDHPNQQDFVLAAFERCVLGGGPLVVVGDSSAASVAHWLQLIGMLLLPANAWRLPFSTYERLSDAGTASGWPFSVVGVPATDAATAAGLPGPRFVLLQDGDAPVRAGLGRWKLQDRTELVAGPWAQLADTVVLAGLLPDVVHQIDALSVECGDSAVSEPLWALGAALLLLEDLPMDDLARDAAELTLAHWPGGLVLGRGTTEKLLRRMTEYAGAGRVAPVLLDRSTAGGSAALATELVLLGPLREALDSPTAFARLGDTLPATPPVLQPAAADELAEILGEALGWVGLAGADAPPALLRIAALMDARSGPAADRARAADLARSLLLPALLDPDADPVASGWPPIPPWLWDEVAPSLVPVLDIGRHEPGRALSEATHRWLGPRSLPRGELTTETLRATGPVQWERAAFRVLRERPRPRDLTPLERAAAFLSTVQSSAVNDGVPEDLWATEAARYAFPKQQLDLRHALVLMEVLGSHVPFHPVLLDVLARTPVTRESAEAVARLRDRETLAAAVDAELAQYDIGVGESDVLVTERREIVQLTSEAIRLGWGASGWAAVAEALLRVETGALPLRELASFTWESEMPWDQGFQMLTDRHTDPVIRVLLAAHLVCRGARAGAFPAEDQATKWLTVADGRGAPRYESAAADLLAGVEDAGTLLGQVEMISAAVPLKPRSRTAAAAHRREEEHPDDRWRTEATSAARRVIKRLAWSAPRARGPRRTARADKP